MNEDREKLSEIKLGVIRQQVISQTTDECIKTSINSRKPEAVNVFKKLDLNVLNNIFESKEQNKLNPIMKEYERENRKT